MKRFPVIESFTASNDVIWTDLHRVWAASPCEALRVKYAEYHLTAGIVW